MATYHFVIDDGGERPTLEPVKLESIEFARLEAARVLGDLVKHEANVLWDTGGLRLTVKNDADLTLFEILVVATDAAASIKKPRPG